MQQIQRIETHHGVEEIKDEKDEEQKRFEVELEFVQSLANPEYLQCNLFLFTLFPYRYPHALSVLELIQDPKAREELKRDDNIAILRTQQTFHWMYYYKKR